MEEVSSSYVSYIGVHLFCIDGPSSLLCTLHRTHCCGIPDFRTFQKFVTFIKTVQPVRILLTVGTKWNKWNFGCQCLVYTI